MKIGLIYARASNGVIGNQGKLPWHLPQDLRHFKKVTEGGVVIMGRKTWDSLPVKPLPGRWNMVLSKTKTEMNGCVSLAHSVDEALERCQQFSSALGGVIATVWVIGGEEIFKQTMPLASEAWVTEIDQAFEGDALAPKLDESWVEMSRECHVDKSGLRFCFVRYVRNSEPSYPNLVLVKKTA